MKMLNAVRFFTSSDFNFVTGYTYDIKLFSTRISYVIKQMPWK